MRTRLGAMRCVVAGAWIALGAGCAQPSREPAPTAPTAHAALSDRELEQQRIEARRKLDAATREFFQYRTGAQGEDAAQDANLARLINAMREAEWHLTALEDEQSRRKR